MRGLVDVHFWDVLDPRTPVCISDNHQLLWCRADMAWAVITRALRICPLLGFLVWLQELSKRSHSLASLTLHTSTHSKDFRCLWSSLLNVILLFIILNNFIFFWVSPYWTIIFLELKKSPCIWIALQYLWLFGECSLLSAGLRILHTWSSLVLYRPLKSFYH